MQVLIIGKDHDDIRLPVASERMLRLASRRPDGGVEADAYAQEPVEALRRGHIGDLSTCVVERKLKVMMSFLRSKLEL